MGEAARPLHRAARAVARWAGLAVIGYALLVAAMFAGQRALLFRPDARAVDPADANLPGLQAIALRAADGVPLVAWWKPPRDAAAPVWLYLHGNGANLLSRDARFRVLAGDTAPDGAGLLALSWRGYGGSGGSPSGDGLLLDARAAYDWLIQQRMDPQRILLFGESLGTTVAVMLAAERPVKAIVLDSAFDSALDVARRSYPWLPVKGLMRDPLRADEAAPRVAVPVLQVHCRDDPVTPPASAQALHARLPAGRPLLWIEGRCHTPRLGGWLPQLRGFVASLPPT